jgi:hypothetical protein
MGLIHDDAAACEGADELVGYGEDRSADRGKFLPTSAGFSMPPRDQSRCGATTWKAKRGRSSVAPAKGWSFPRKTPRHSTREALCNTEIVDLRHFHPRHVREIERGDRGTDGATFEKKGREMDDLSRSGLQRVGMLVGSVSPKCELAPVVQPDRERLRGFADLDRHSYSP